MVRTYSYMRLVDETGAYHRWNAYLDNSVSNMLFLQDNCNLELTLLSLGAIMRTEHFMYLY